MRRSTILAASFAMLLGAGGTIYFTIARSIADKRDQEFRDLIVRSRSEHPQRGLGRDWLDCQEHHRSEENRAADRVVCKAWTQQGVTSTLIALQFGANWVPVIESRLASTADGGPVVLHIEGGPGAEPFQVSEAMGDEFLAEQRRIRPNELPVGDIRKSPYYLLLDRGYTIASIGYWGMNFKTLNVRGEFELAARDVSVAVDYYRDRQGADLPLVTFSLGNHLALAALGKDRIEKMNVLALVPVMDGLQHHLKTSLSAMAEELAEAEDKGHPYGNWTFFAIYKHSDEGMKFDHSRMLPMHDYVPQFIGAADFAWKDVTPGELCSKVVLGNKDPRTLAYLKATNDLPDFVRVLKADHDLFKDAPDQSQGVFLEFADCLISRTR